MPRPSVLTQKAVDHIRQRTGEGATSETISGELAVMGFQVSPPRVRYYRHSNPVVQRFDNNLAAIPEPLPIPDKVTQIREQFEEVAVRYLKDHIPLPSIPEQIRATKVEDMGFNEPEHAVALFSDYHFGGKVDPRVTAGIGGYDKIIARERLARWRNKVLRFVQMHQLVVEVPVLHLFALGDDMEGNGHMFPTQALQMEESIMFQYLGFVEDMTEVMLSLLERFERINVYKVFGNHGRTQGRWKDNFDPDNFELMAWHAIKDRCMAAAPDRFTFDIEMSFILLTDILGYLFVARHGDGTSLNSTYTGLQDTKLRMNSVFGQIINYLLVAHHHVATEREEEISGSVISNGCFVGPSLLALKGKRPAANLPSQEVLFFNTKYGKTRQDRIHLATVEEVRQPRIYSHT